jgi:hypothetical protein
LENLPDKSFEEIGGEFNLRTRQNFGEEILEFNRWNLFSNLKNLADKLAFGTEEFQQI